LILSITLRFSIRRRTDASSRAYLCDSLIRLGRAPHGAANVPPLEPRRLARLLDLEGVRFLLFHVGECHAEALRRIVAAQLKRRRGVP
jgi:hypothetical protein